MKKLAAPSIIPGRRAFLKGAAALSGSAAMLAELDAMVREADARSLPAGPPEPFAHFAQTVGATFGGGSNAITAGTCPTDSADVSGVGSTRAAVPPDCQLKAMMRFGGPLLLSRLSICLP
jgi:hypothetical protein